MSKVRDILWCTFSSASGKTKMMTEIETQKIVFRANNFLFLKSSLNNIFQIGFMWFKEIIFTTKCHKWHPLVEQ